MKRACVIALMLCEACPAAGVPSASKISDSEAKLLAIAALGPAERKLPNLEAVPYSPGPSIFLFFNVIGEDGPRHGRALIRSYAVDPSTADVFSTTSDCHEEKNERLEALQEKVREAIHLSPTSYRQRKTGGPLCD